MALHPRSIAVHVGMHERVSGSAGMSEIWSSFCLQVIHRLIKYFGECCVPCWKRSELLSSSFFLPYQKHQIFLQVQTTCCFLEPLLIIEQISKTSSFIPAPFPASQTDAGKTATDVTPWPVSAVISFISSCFPAALNSALQLCLSQTLSGRLQCDLKCGINTSLSAIILAPGSFVAVEFRMNYVCVSAPWLPVGCSACD